MKQDEAWGKRGPTSRKGVVTGGLDARRQPKARRIPEARRIFMVMRRFRERRRFREGRRYGARMRPK